MPAAGPDPSAAAKGSRLAYLPDEGRFEPIETFDGERLEPGNRIAGTGVVETEGSTLVVWKDQRLTVNRYGRLRDRYRRLGGTGGRPVENILN